MKIVVAMDSFKGSLSALEACQAVREGLTRARPNGDLQIEMMPVADGGEGTAAAMLGAQRGEWVEMNVMGPLPDMEVRAGYAWFPRDRTALVEMAAASGFTLVPAGRANPLETTTYGTGQLIAAAAQRGARRILLAVGGSATVDGGVGAATALGWRFLDDSGADVGLGGEALGRIAAIERPDQTVLPPMEVLCDVHNALTGSEGAARIYGPQKGADSAMVEMLESGMRNLAAIVRSQLGVEIETVPGTGAAGGLAAGAVAFMDASLVPGIETVLAAIRLEESLQDAAWVVTGEGKFDRQSMYGKVVAGVVELAKRSRTRIALLAGRIDVEKDSCRELGIYHAFAMCGQHEDPSYAMEHGYECLSRVAEQLLPWMANDSS